MGEGNAYPSWKPNCPSGTKQEDVSNLLLFEAAHSEIECGQVTDWSRWALAVPDFSKASSPVELMELGSWAVSTLLACSCLV
jgi:hypothetical protein